jgi:NAD-dependent dihydropyrimidine dehydrogenase PreA subunit
MGRVKDFFWELFHTFFRYYNFPCKLGLIRVGQPNESSPVFVSGNYTLTVKRLLRKLKLSSIDCYLLVANSRGCNVWCAVGMNEFSDFDIIDAINVSGLRGLVNHQRIIVPVYAAPGVDIGAVKRETGFNVHWGPTHLNDLPRYIKNGLKRTSDMYLVKFGFQDRLEQAMATALAYTMTIGIGAIFWPAFVGRIIGLIFIVYFFGFCLYPFFPEERRWRRAGLQTAILLGTQTAFGVWRGWTPFDHLLWGVILLGLILLMVLDQCGSTPLHKTSIKHWLTKGDYLSLFNPIIDPELCINCMQCVLVCPTGVFAARRQDVKTVVAVKPDSCEECLACVKQCPTDAIFNRNTGQIKGDVKSIPNLVNIISRDWAHLRGEQQWIGAPITFRNGLPVVIENGNHGSEVSEPRREVVSATVAETLTEVMASGDADARGSQTAQGTMLP